MRVLVGVCLLLAAFLARADTLAGVVIVVIDGDTVLFRPDHDSPSSRAFLKVRLADIDAPEKGQPHGDAATQALKALVLSQEVELETVATDVYGRTLGRLRLGSVAVGAELVRRGLAWAYDSTRASARSGSESFRASSRDPQHVMRVLQDEARAARRGLWQDVDPMPPWAWRRTHPADAALSR